MFQLNYAIFFVGILGLASFAWCLCYGLWNLLGLSLSEIYIKRLMNFMACSGLILTLMQIAALSFFSPHFAYLDLGRWFGVGEYKYNIEIAVGIKDAIFLAVTHLVLLAIVRFSANYLHRDPGYQKFMLLLSLMQFGVVVVVTAGHFDLLMFGWELVGIASFLLIGFFTEHASAGRQSYWAMLNYKVADIGLILGTLFLHDLRSSTSLDHLGEFVGQSLSQGHENKIFFIGLLFIFGTLAKGGQIPFFGWVPRAMEGPTPSSAIFYGALSVHLAPLLLMKSAPLWEWSWSLRIVVASIGLLTTFCAYYTAKAVANVKGQLAYQVMAQVGIMYCEIAAGFYDLAFLHICCHAALRTRQFIRSPSLLQDCHEYPDILLNIRRHGDVAASFSPSAYRLYVHAFNGFYFEAVFAKVTILLNIISKVCHSLVMFFIGDREWYQYMWNHLRKILRQISDREEQIKW